MVNNIRIYLINGKIGWNSGRYRIGLNIWGSCFNDNW